jgi:hypothetical protein
MELTVFSAAFFLYFSFSLTSKLLLILFRLILIIKLLFLFLNHSIQLDASMNTELLEECGEGEKVQIQLSRARRVFSMESSDCCDCRWKKKIEETFFSFVRETFSSFCVN